MDYQKCSSFLFFQRNFCRNENVVRNRIIWMTRNSRDSISRDQHSVFCFNSIVIGCRFLIWKYSAVIDRVASAIYVMFSPIRGLYAAKQKTTKQ